MRTDYTGYNFQESILAHELLYRVFRIAMFLPGMFLGGFLAWYIMRRWLAYYAYRTGMDGWVFIIGPAIILAVALLTAGFRTWKASRRSPAQTLKYQ